MPAHGFVVRIKRSNDVRYFNTGLAHYQCSVNKPKAQKDQVALPQVLRSSEPTSLSSQRGALSNPSRQLQIYEGFHRPPLCGSDSYRAPAAQKTRSRLMSPAEAAAGSVRRAPCWGGGQRGPDGFSVAVFVKGKEDGQPREGLRAAGSNGRGSEGRQVPTLTLQLWSALPHRLPPRLRHSWSLRPRGCLVTLCF